MLTKAVLLNKNRSGKQQIYIRLYVNGWKQPKYKPTGMYIDPAQFDSSACRIHDSYPNSRILNLALIDLETKYERELLGEKTGTFDNGVSLNEYWLQHSANIAKECTEIHIEKLGSAIKKFELFRPGAILNDVDYNYLKDYKLWCLDRGNSINTITKNMEQLRAAIREARSDGKYNPAIYPFDKFKLRTEETSIGRLSRDEIKKLEDYAPKNRNEHIAKIMFLFSFYNGSVRISDLCRLRWSDISKDEILFVPTKTKKSIAEKSVPISPPVEALIDEIKSEFGTKTFVFPVLEGKGQLAETDILKEIKSFNAIVNTKLKLISKNLKFSIGSALSIHKSKHTFAEISSENKTDLRTNMVLLGHKKISTTIRYMDKFNKKMTGDAIESMFGKKNQNQEE